SSGPSSGRMGRTRTVSQRARRDRRRTPPRCAGRWSRAFRGGRRRYFATNSVASRLMVTRSSFGHGGAATLVVRWVRARSGPEFEDDVDRGSGDVAELAEAGAGRQLPDRGGAGLGAERDTAGLGQGGGRALECGRGVAERRQRVGEVRRVVVGC